MGDFQGAAQLSGFFLQEAEPDDDPATSEGIFVYDAGRGPAVELGDRVRLEGEVREYEGTSGRGAPLTELVEPRQLSICARAQKLASTPIDLPVAKSDVWERYEGMRVHFPQRLHVTDNYELRRYGVLGVAPERLFAATQRVDPGAPARERTEQNALAVILVDDGSASRDPEPRHPGPDGSGRRRARRTGRRPRPALRRLPRAAGGPRRDRRRQPAPHRATTGWRKAARGGLQRPQSLPHTGSR